MVEVGNFKDGVQAVGEIERWEAIGGTAKIESRKSAVGFLSSVDVERVGYVWAVSTGLGLAG